MSQTARPFVLHPNKTKSESRQILMFYAIVLLPLLVTALLLYHVFDLRGTAFLALLILAIIILLNIHLFFMREKSRTARLSLSIGFDEIRLIHKDKILNTAPLEGIYVCQLGWGSKKENQLPAIQIQGHGFPKLSIGSTHSVRTWEDIRKYTEITDFLIPSEKEWKRLLYTLKKTVKM